MGFLTSPSLAIKGSQGLYLSIQDSKGRSSAYRAGVLKSSFPGRIRGETNWPHGWELLLGGHRIAGTRDKKQVVAGCSMLWDLRQVHYLCAGNKVLSFPLGLEENLRPCFNFFIICPYGHHYHEELAPETVTPECRV